MKKTRIIRALKNCKSTQFETGRVLSFMNIITQDINTILDRTFDIIDDVKLRDKILKELNNDKK